MALLGTFLDTGDKVASIVGAVTGVLALAVALRAGRNRSRRDPLHLVLFTLAALLAAAIAMVLVPSVPVGLAGTASWVVLPLTVLVTGVSWLARRRRYRPDDAIARLLLAQRTDADKHRYRFFGQHVPALTDLYVRHRVRFGGLGERETSRTVDAAQLLVAHRHIVLLGEPGAGKSTFLITMAGNLATRWLAGRAPSEVAATVRASDLIGCQLPDALAGAVQRDLDVALPANAFERAPAPGAVWRVLVDGLDEVTDPHDRSTVLWRLRNLLASDGLYRFLITSRPLADAELNELRLPHVGEYELRAFDHADLSTFAHRWFAARHPTDPRRAEKAAGTFLARVAGARLGSVVRVPLLATISALVYEQADGSSLPSSRATLYDRFVSHLLDGRTSLASVVDVTVSARGAAGEELTSWLRADLYGHVAGILGACGSAWLLNPDSSMTDVAAEWIRKRAPHDLVAVSPNGERILQELLAATGILTMRRNALVFVHQSFAEYLAARDRDADFDPSVWHAQAADPSTRSIAAFAAARRPDSDALVCALLDDNPVAAGDLLAAGVPVSGITNSQVVDRLLEELTQESPQAPDALRILGDLSLDPRILHRLTQLAADTTVSPWTRALVADRIADVDTAAGVRLLQALTDSDDVVVRAWAADSLEDRGASPHPDLRIHLIDDGHAAGHKPLGALARYALNRRLSDARASDAERLDAARQLAHGGDTSALLAIIDSVGLSRLDRVRVADTIADIGEHGPLRQLAFGENLDTWPPADRGDLQRAAYAAGVSLLRRGDSSAPQALRRITESAQDKPMAYAAAALLADIGDLEPLTMLVGQASQPLIQWAAARRLAAIGDASALSRSLDASMSAESQAEILAALIRAGRTDVMPRLNALLSRHRFRSDRLTDLLYLMAAHGDIPSRDRLHRRTRHRRGSRDAIHAAVALTALDDPRGAAALRAVATQPMRRTRTRIRAAASLARINPVAGRAVVSSLASERFRPRLRWRAIATAAQVLHDVTPLALVTLAPNTPRGTRVQAVDALADVLQGIEPPSYGAWTSRPLRRLSDLADEPAVAVLPEEIRTSLLAVATDPVASGEVRAAVAGRLLPDDEARTVLSDLASGGGEHSTGTRIAAIERLELVDPLQATIQMRNLVRDARIPRLLRWVAALRCIESMSLEDKGVLDARLDSENPWVVVLRSARLVLSRPEQVFDTNSPYQ